MLKRSKKTALILALVMLLTVFGTCMVSADSAPEGNLLPNFGFEEGSAKQNDNPKIEGWTCLYVPEYMEDNGNNFVRFTQGRSMIYKTGIALKPNTSYVVGFKFQASLENSVMVVLEDFKVNEKSLDSYVSENGLIEQPKSLIQYTGSAQPIADGAAVGKLGWKTAKLEFITPAYIDSATLRLRAVANNVDTNACVDDVYMLEEGEPSTKLMVNGGFDYYTNKEEGSFLGWHVINSTATNSTIEVIEDDENTYARITAHATTGDKILGQTVSLEPGNYALSFRHKADTTDNLRIGVHGTNVLGTNASLRQYYYSFGNESDVGVWKNHTMYFAVTGNEKSSVTITTAGAPSRFRGTHSYDDFVLTRDETKVDFHSAFKMHPTLDTDYGRYGVDFAPISAISGGTLDETTNKRTVVSRAHYLPKTDAAESFVFLTCVYKYTETDKTLESVRIQNKTVQGGVPGDAVNTVEVPALAEEGVTYKVESFIWNSFGDLESVAEPVTLE